MRNIRKEPTKIVVKYSLQEMFDDPADVDYKLETKLDFSFASEDSRDSHMGYKVATRDTKFISLENQSHTLGKNPRTKTKLTSNEVRREELWSNLC